MNPLSNEVTHIVVKPPGAFEGEYMVPLELTDQEIGDLVAFLESLSGTRIGSNRIDMRAPASVPSDSSFWV